MGDGQCLKKAGEVRVWWWRGGYRVPFVSGLLLSVQHGRPRNRCQGQHYL